MNSFSIGKCWSFGRMIPDEFSGTWEELLVHPEWQPFVERHELREIQIAYIERGMKGMPFQDPQKEGDLFPFGQHKNKTFAQVPDKYWDWLEKQSWLEKWPSVALHVKERLKEKQQSQLSKEDIASILSLI